MIKSMCFVFLLSMTSCAYKLGYTDKSLPENHTKLSIPMFKNTTGEVGVETYFTNALVRQFHRSKIAKIIPKKRSQVMLVGEIKEIKYSDRAQISPNNDNLLPNNTVLITDYLVSVRARLTLKNISDGRVLWFDDFEGERVYSAPQITIAGANSANPNYDNSVQRQNLKAIAQEMMAEAHERMTENF